MGKKSKDVSMTGLEITRRRLCNQYLTKPAPGGPDDVVGWLGAVQAQDYAGAKWALGLRLEGATDRHIDRAFAEGAILRTHLLRPTWHFVTPADIRWMLKLTAPRVHVANAHMYRKLELDDAIFKRSNTALAKALRGGKQLTRDELRTVLSTAGLATDDGLRMTYLMMRAELDGVVCSGARRGKQFTYGLLDERAPRARTLQPEEALAELSHRYFMSRGPATVHDFAKWSGLTVADARRGLEMIKDQLQHEVMDGQSYWFSSSKPAAEESSPAVYLLSIYDEYISGYKDRSAMIDADHGEQLIAMGNALGYIIVVDGQIIGTWNRLLSKDKVHIKTNLFRRLTKAEDRALTLAIQQYGKFLELPVATAS